MPWLSRKNLCILRSWRHFPTARFGWRYQDPMIISRTPFRVSFFGGGTDYPAWYSQHGGAVLAAAIQRYCYISCRVLPPFFPHRFRIAYSQIENALAIEDIQHPVVRACLQLRGIADGLEIHHDSDLPKQTGLGTSSSFAVGMLNALSRLEGKTVPSMDLAAEATYVERVLCRENVGSQDQVTTAIGGLNRIDFGRNGEIQVTPLGMPPQRVAEFQQRLMLFFTGFSRHASDIVTEQLATMNSKQRELHDLRDMVDEAERLLRGPSDPWVAFGRLLHEGWEIKRTLSRRISTAPIDEMYAAARRAGAIGGKLCGAGSGGFLLLIVQPERQTSVAAALNQQLHVPVSFDFQGTQIIFDG